MSGNSFGKIFKVTTFGESHGPALGAVVDGVPPRLELCEKDIQKELDRRRPGQSKVTSPRREGDKVEILSGVFNGKTTGAPVALLIRNSDQKSKDYTKLKDFLRPGHADFTYLAKYGIRDWRGGGRASGRETVSRVAAGAIAKKILARKNINVIAYTLSIGGIVARNIDLRKIESNIVRCPDIDQAKKMIKRITDAQKEKDSLGGVIEALVKNCPAGLGDPVFDKLDACLAHAVMSIGIVKGVEFGHGFEIAKMKGSQVNDSYCVKKGHIGTVSNFNGGIAGGISTGEDIILRAALKPTPSIGQSQKSITTSKKTVTLEIEGRHDPCVVPRAVPVVEAMIAITLVDCLMKQTGISKL
ncbi:MAG: chorismate synthase [Candidatus Omnitrophota bacterium]